MSDSDANSGCCFLWTQMELGSTGARGKRRRRRASSRQRQSSDVTSACACDGGSTTTFGWRRIYSKSRRSQLPKPSRHAPQNSFDTAPLRYPRLPTRLPSTSRSRAATVTRVAGSHYYGFITTVNPVSRVVTGQIQKCARIPRNRSLCSSRNAWSTVCLGSCTFHACAMTVYASNVK